MVLMVMESLIWSFMVCMILCGLVWLSVVYYANVFPCKVSNGLVWLCMVLQLCTIFVLFRSGCFCQGVCGRQNLVHEMAA